MTKYKVELNSIGDPERGQDPLKQVQGAWAVMAHTDTIEEACEAVRVYMAKHDLSPANWAGGKLWTEENEYMGQITHDGTYKPKENDNIRAF